MVPIDTPRTLGRAVTEARTTQKLTQGQLARAAGVSRQLVNRLEMGSAPGISLNNLMAILAQVNLGIYLDQEDGPVTATIPQPSDAIDFIYMPKLDMTLFDAPTGGC